MNESAIPPSRDEEKPFARCDVVPVFSRHKMRITPFQVPYSRNEEAIMLKIIGRSLIFASLGSLPLQSGLNAQANTPSKSAPTPAVDQKEEVVPGIVVVKFKRGYSVPGGIVQKSSNILLEQLREQGVMSLTSPFKTVRTLSDQDIAAGKVDLSRMYYAHIDESVDARAVARKLSVLEGVEYAEPKYVHYLCDIPNDSAYASFQQRYFNLMNAPAGWAIAKGSAGIVIATVDGGTNWQHKDLKPNLWINGGEDLNHNGIFEQFVPPPAGDDNGVDDDNNGFIDDVIGWNFGNNSNDPRGFIRDMADHGTGTASTFGAVTNNGAGMAGSSWNCHVMPICASSPRRSEITWGYEGIQYAFMNGATVINCSWGRSGEYSRIEQEIIDAATEAGALVVAAAGNDHTNTDYVPFYPAAYDNVLSVGATSDTDDVKSDYSNYGVNVAVFAPGANIRIAMDDGSYGFGAGTSFAAPLVAGLAGILKSAHPGWGPGQIAAQIRMTADRIDAANPAYSGSMGRGRVNFGRALSESHAGVKLISSSLHAPSGRTLILKGDTLVLSVVAENLLNAPAHNLSFDASSTDPALQVIQGTAAIARLDSGQQVALPDFKFRVGNILSPQTLSVKLEWVSNLNERDAKIFRTTAYGSTGYWSTQTVLPSGGLLSVKAVNRDVAWAAGSMPPEPYGPVVVRTTDGGGIWNDVTGNLGHAEMPVCIAAVDANRAWIGGDAGKIYATTNGGASWSEQVYPGTQTKYIVGLWFFDPDNGYALGIHTPEVPDANTILRTSNGGATWAHLANEPVVGQRENGNLNKFWWTDRDHGWFPTNYDRIWRTTDGGGSWSFAPLSSMQWEAFAVVFRDNTTGLANLGGGWIARSSDGGSSWTPMQIPGVSGNMEITYAPGSHTAWLVDYWDGSYRSDDDGLSWTRCPCDSITGRYYFHVSFADSGSGWIVTGMGQILHYNSAGVTDVAGPGTASVPVGYALEQNYPNPFNPTTTIRYTAGGSGHVTLKLYDVLGREVATLADESKRQGVYTIRFDGSRLASGMYFYRLQAGHFVDTKKLILLR